MSAFTKKEVALYFAGGLDRNRRLEIEAVAETNPDVKRWMAELTPTAAELMAHPPALPRLSPGEKRARSVLAYQGGEEVVDPTPPRPVEPGSRFGKAERTERGYRSVHRLVPVAPFGHSEPKPPTWTPPAVPPAHVIDPTGETVRLIYPAAGMPSGVARVTAVIGERASPPVFVVFPPAGGSGASDVREVRVKLSDLGVPTDKPSEPDVYVVFADESNPGQFPADKLIALRDACNGNVDLARVVAEVLHRLHPGEPT